MRTQILSASAALAVAAFLAYPNDALALSNLVVTVDCASGARINQALSRPTVFDRRLVIVVQGPCIENVAIERDDVVLRAHASGGSIIAADLAKSAIDVNGARRVVLEGLSVVGGHHGVNASGGASVSIRGGAVRGAAQIGIYVGEGASASVDGSTIENHGQFGVLADGASITLTRSTVRANLFSGVLATRGGQVKLGDVDSGGVVCCGNTIADNTLDGVTVADGGSARLYGNTIQRNGSLTGRYGVLVVHESVVRMFGGNVISDNGSEFGGGGVLVRASTIRTGAGDVPLSPTSNEILGNKRWGIIAEINASLDLRGGLSVTRNPAGGVLLSHGSRLRTLESTISNNGRDGITAQFASSMEFLNTASGTKNTVSGNARFGLGCFSESKYNGDVSGITDNPAGNVSCTGF